MITNQEFYSTVGFSGWAHLEGLNADEQYLVDRFLDKHKKTVEAGTAGGRILFSLKELGFTSLYGFDYVPAFIEQAQQRDVTQSICFDVQDATQLAYEDASFEQLIYLQQILSTIESDYARRIAAQEAYRILKAGEVALFSFLGMEIRSSVWYYRLYLMYLKLFRQFMSSERSIQYLPFLKTNNKVNLLALSDQSPHNYWYRLPEIELLLKTVGFEIEAVGSSHQIQQKKLCTSVQELQTQPLAGAFYVVCRKPK